MSDESASETFTEWRVTGDPGHGYPRYGFTWSPDRGDGDPEASARGFLALITDQHHAEWVDGPHLHSRQVTRTEWRAEEVING
jgi:hypothetical protein